MPVNVAKARELFLAALEMPAGERAAYLDSACGGDPALRQRLEFMLRTHEDSGELLSRSPAEMLADGGATEEEGTGAWPPQPDTPATLNEPPGEGPDGLPFLAPSAKPGHLGRLAHYEVQEVLGRGGFGIVLKAFDEKLHRAVAIKVLAPAYATVGSARERFIREARAAAAVKNEHVVAIYNVQDEAQPPYLVMELIDGLTLQEKLDKKGPLSVKETLRIGMQTAEGLAAAHRQGLVHRDIKPANILLENGVERVKLTDFGLARAVDDASVSQSGTVAGTPMYMSPEQAEGLAVDPRSDLFSLGSVLYAMCTGHPPFRASGTHAVLKRVIEETPRPIPEVNPEIPTWLCEIVARLHAKRPAERFQAANEVADLLGQHLAHLQQPGRVPQPLPLEQPNTRSTTPTGRRRLWLSAAALAALALLGVWLGPWLKRYALNTGYLWISGGPQVRVKLVRAQDGAVIEQGNLAWWGRELPPGDYVLEADYDRSRWVCEYLIQSDFPLAASATTQKADRVGFAVLRGEYVTVSLSLSPRQQRQPEGGPGWRRLYDGKTYAGWKAFGKSSAGRGELLLLPGGGVETDEKMPRNFHLRMEVKLVRGPGAVSFPARPAPDKPGQPPGASWHLVFTESPAARGLVDSETLGVPPDGAVTTASRAAGVARVGEWFRLEILATAGHTEFRVNGQPYQHIKRLLPTDCVLRLSNRGDGDAQIAFRNIEVKELPPSAKPGPPVLAGWGEVVNPGGVSQIKEMNGRLHITLPGPLADLHPGVDLGAPRILQEVDGDFTLSVQLFAGRHPQQDKEKRTGYVGSGLLVWQDDRNFLTMQRGFNASGNAEFSYDCFEDAVSRQILPVPAEPRAVRLRLQRRGARVRSSYSYDGVTWKEHYDFGKVRLGRRVKVGVVAVNTSGVPYQAAFENLRLTRDPEPGWVRLFNGKDTAGWKTLPGKKGNWKVEAGELVGRGSPDSYLFSKAGHYRDFHLRAEVNLNALGNSGVFFRTPFEESAEGPTGYEADLSFIKGSPNSPVGTLWKGGKRVQRALKSTAAPDQWFVLEVIACGPRVQVFVNGQAVADYTDAASGARSGHIALQALEEDTVVRFKKIEIKELPPAGPG